MTDEVPAFARNPIQVPYTCPQCGARGRMSDTDWQMHRMSGHPQKNGEALAINEAETLVLSSSGPFVEHELERAPTKKPLVVVRINVINNPIWEDGELIGGDIVDDSVWTEYVDVNDVFDIDCAITNVKDVLLNWGD